jgi:hypothetical protein
MQETAKSGALVLFACLCADTGGGVGVRWRFGVGGLYCGGGQVGCPISSSFYLPLDFPVTISTGYSQASLCRLSNPYFHAHIRAQLRALCGQLTFTLRDDLS